MKINWKSALKCASTFGKKRLPEILTGIGIVGYFSATWFAIKATPGAKEKLDTALKEKQKFASDNERVKLGPIECVRVVWKDYFPTAAMLCVSTACIVGASATNMKRNAALAAAYSMTEATLHDYKEKIVDVVGEKKAEEIKNEVIKKELKETPKDIPSPINTGYGHMLIYDTVSGRYFYSDIEKIRQTVNEINRRLRDEIGISVNEFYDELGLDHISIGYEIGWNIEKGYLDTQFSSQLTPEGLAFIPPNIPCIVMEFNYTPHYEYV